MDTACIFHFSPYIILSEQKRYKAIDFLRSYGGEILAQDPTMKVSRDVDILLFSQKSNDYIAKVNVVFAVSD